MKRLWISLFFVVTVLMSGCHKKDEVNRIYVFSQPGCIHCEHAKEYMDRYYKNYDIKNLNIREGNNITYMLRYAKKYKISEQNLGTPLIIMGNNYIMGWGIEQQKQFNRYAKNFKPKEK